MKNYLLIAFIFLSAQTIAQTTIPFDTAQWVIRAAGVKTGAYKGQQSIYADGGMALLKRAAFLNGTIEFDIFPQDVFSFPGVSFRLQDNDNMEEFYIRPFENGKEDATQYSPVYNGVSGWQLYKGKNFANAVNFPRDEWFHVKMVVKDQKASFFIGQDAKPALESILLRPSKTGGIAINFGRAYFANFKITNDPAKPGPDAPATRLTFPENVITNWLLSEPVAENIPLTSWNNPAFLGPEKWTAVQPATEEGMVNIAITKKLSQEKNTVLARFDIQADNEMVKKLTFGFSDRVKVYLNGDLLYAANDGFRTRDFRFLGTIGFFDSLFLHLKKGTNTVILAVSETFGGWGVQAKLDSAVNE